MLEIKKLRHTKSNLLIKDYGQVKAFNDPHSGRDLALRTIPILVIVSDLYFVNAGARQR